VIASPVVSLLEFRIPLFGWLWVWLMFLSFPLAVLPFWISSDHRVIVTTITTFTLLYCILAQGETNFMYRELCGVRHFCLLGLH